MALSKIRAELALDIETTGPTSKDVIFAIGLCWGTRVNGTFRILGSSKILRDLQKPAGMSWASFWEIQGYDQKCWDEFWSQHTDQLDQLQARAVTTEITLVKDNKSFSFGAEAPKEDLLPNSSDSLTLVRVNKSKSDEVLAEVFDRALITLEADYDLTTVFDTTVYDGGWLNNLLIQHQLGPLYPFSHHRCFNTDTNGNLKDTSRHGQYRSGVEVDSFLMGTLNGCDLDWKEMGALKAQLIDPLLPELGPSSNSHDPEADARNILLTYYRGCQFQRQRAAALQEARGIDFSKVHIWFLKFWHLFSFSASLPASI